MNDERARATYGGSASNRSQADGVGFRGICEPAQAAREAAASLYAPEFVETALGDVDHDETACQFVLSVIDGLADDISIIGVVDTLECAPTFMAAADESLFREWLGLATRSDLSAVARAACLRAALVFKRADARRGLRLASTIVEADLGDDPLYLAHAASIGGFLTAERQFPEVIEFLVSVQEIEGVSDQALFELGMITLGKALNADSVGAAKSGFSEAKGFFAASEASREARWDSRIFCRAISVLEQFESRESLDVMQKEIAELQSDYFAFAKYVHDEPDNIIVRSKARQIAAWAALGVRLGTLTQAIEDEIWLDGRAIIEQELLAAYAANRSVLARTADGGVDFLIRPQIEAGMIRNRAQLLALRKWVKGSEGAILGQAASQLLAAVEEQLGGSAPPDPPGAAIGSPPFVAATDDGLVFPDSISDTARAAILRSASIECERLSYDIMRCLDDVCEAFGGLADFAIPTVRTNFLALLYKTMLFIEHRLDATVSQDPTGRYLFAEEGENNALEKELQQDFLRFLRNSKLGTCDEVRGCGAGRADVFHEFGRVKLITEIKREQVDASFENLLDSYGEQTAAYQSTNVKLGMLLVLDLTPDQSRHPHISTLYKPMVRDMANDRTDRGVMVIRLPGNRTPPNEASKRTRRSGTRTKAKRASVSSGPARKRRVGDEKRKPRDIS